MVNFLGEFRQAIYSLESEYTPARVILVISDQQNWFD